MSLTPCPHCLRHVRRTEARCPFCERALSIDRTANRPWPTRRLGRAALAAFGAAAVSTSMGACGARGGLDVDEPRVAPPTDAGSFVRAPDGGRDAARTEEDASALRDASFPRDTGPDAELVLPPYGGPWLDDAAVDPMDEDAGGISSDYGGPPEP